MATILTPWGTTPPQKWFASEATCCSSPRRSSSPSCCSCGLSSADRSEGRLDHADVHTEDGDDIKAHVDTVRASHAQPRSREASQSQLLGAGHGQRRVAEC